MLDAERRREKLAGERALLDLDALTAAFADIEQRHDAQKSGIDTLQSDVESRKQAVTALQDEQRQLATQLADSRRAAQEKRGRLSSLETLQSAALGQEPGAAVAWLRQRGLECQSFALLARAPQWVFGVGTRALPGFRRLAQLRGGKIGIAAQDPATHWFAKQVMSRSGLGPDDVEYVALASPLAAVVALRDGEVSAVAYGDPLISLLEARGDIRVAVDTRLLRSTQELFGGPMPGAALYATVEFLQRNPRTAQGVTNAVVKALKWLQTAGPSDIVRAVPEVGQQGDRAVFLNAFEKSREALSPDGVLSDQGAQNLLRLMDRYAPATHPARLAADTVYTNEFARRAKQRFQA